MNTPTFLKADRKRLLLALIPSAVPILRQHGYWYQAPETASPKRTKMARLCPNSWLHIHTGIEIDLEAGILPGVESLTGQEEHPWISTRYLTNYARNEH